MKGIYLAGSIEGISDTLAKGWRDDATKFFATKDIKVWDPTRRISYRDSPQDLNAQRRIVKMDLQDIANSSVVIANLRDTCPGKKWGTLMEVAHAHTKNKIIIVWLDQDQWVHPFVGFYATEIHYNLADAMEAAAEYFN